MIVCIAEKPSVARDIARILGANRSLYPERAWRLHTRLETLGTDTVADGTPALRHQTD